MKLRRLIPFFIVGILLLSGCKKTCRCYRYDGNVEEFSDDDLDSRNMSCAEMETFNLGNVYSLCEKVII